MHQSRVEPYPVVAAEDVVTHYYARMAEYNRETSERK
jgi:hypothetical protein